MSEKNLIPSKVVEVTEATNSIIEQMKAMGLKYRDVKLLIKDRTGNKVSMTDIGYVLDAMQSIEKQFMVAYNDSV